MEKDGNLENDLRIAECINPPDSGDKWIISVISGIIFLIVASGTFGNVLQWCYNGLGIKNNKILTLVLQTIIFIVIVRLMMG